MKTVTPEQFKTFGPCWLETAEGRKRFRIVSALRPEWTALDVLALPDVSAKDKLWSVLRKEFLPAELLHEFACRCAEYAMTFVKEPDPRSIAAIVAKRAWVRGEITADELRTTRDAALDAAEAVTRFAAARAAAWAAWDAADIAARAAWDAAETAARAAAWEAADAVWDDAREAAREHEVDMLVELIKERMPAEAATSDEHKESNSKIILTDGEGEVNAGR